MNVDKGLHVLQVRAPAELVEDIDNWRIRQGLPVLSRAEAMRQLLQQGLVDAQKGH